MWLTCDDASRALVLARLSEEAGFMLGTAETPAGRVTLDLQDVPLEQALATLLEGVPFSIEYAAERDENRRLAWVRVGALGSGAPAPGSEPALVPERHPTPERARAASIAVATEDLGDEGLQRRLTSADSRERAEAVGDLVADGEELTWLVSLATDDPDPEVRIAALEELEGEESYAVLRTLIRTLEDPEPAVVVRALEAIAFLGDSTLRAQIEPLADHRDASVRAALAETLEELEP